MMPPARLRPPPHPPLMSNGPTSGLSSAGYPWQPQSVGGKFIVFIGFCVHQILKSYI